MIYSRLTQLRIGLLAALIAILSGATQTALVKARSAAMSRSMDSPSNTDRFCLPQSTGLRAL